MKNHGASSNLNFVFYGIILLYLVLDITRINNLLVLFKTLTSYYGQSNYTRKLKKELYKLNFKQQEAKTRNLKLSSQYQVALIPLLDILFRIIYEFKFCVLVKN